MARTNGAQVLPDYHRGRFTSALAFLLNSQETRSSMQRATLAELYQLTGDNLKARELCSSLLRMANQETGVLCRSHEILGAVAIDEGRVRSAKEHLNRALALAQQANDVSQVCRVQLRLIPTLSEVECPASAAAFSSEVRRNVLRSGDPHLLALLHLRFAQLEAKSGLLETSWRHLESGWRLVGDSPNHWIDGLLSLDASSVATMNSEFERARNLAARALQCGHNSGHVRTVAAALCNLCILALQSGDLEGAEDYAAQATPIVDGFVSLRASLVDTMAQIAILRRESSVAKQRLDQVDSWLAQRPDLSQSWLALSVLLTRVRLARQHGHWQEAVDVCDRAVDLAGTRNDVYLGALFRLTKADLLIAQGLCEDAKRLVLEVDAFLSDPPLAILAELERVRGRLATRSGEVARSIDHTTRAGRIVRNAGTEWDRRDLQESVCEVFDTPVDGAGQEVAHEVSDGPSQLVGNGLDSPRTIPSRPSLDPLAIEAAAKLHSFVGRPELLAFECVSLLDGLACSAQWTLTEVS